MNKLPIDQEIPPHKRRKGKKLYTLERRLTPEGAERRRAQEEERIQKELPWSKWWTKYEKLKHTEQALADINKKKENASEWQNYLKDYEYRIVNSDGN